MATRFSFKSLYAKGGLYQLMRFSIKVIKLFFILKFTKPEEMAAYGIFSVIIFFLENASKTGIADYLIVEDDNFESWNTAWSIELIRNISLFFISLPVGYLLCNFYEILEYYDVFFVLSLGFVINGLKNIYIIELRKKIQLNKYILYNSIPVILHLAVTVVLFYVLSPLMAIVCGLLFQHALHVILSYGMTAKRPNFALSLVFFKRQYSFGKWVFVQTWLDFLNEKSDRLLFGYVLPQATFGLYAVASGFTSDLQSQLRSLLRAFVFPALKSHSSENATTIRKIILKQSALLSILFLIGLLVLKGFIRYEIFVLINPLWRGIENLLLPLLAVAYTGVLLSQFEAKYLAEARPKYYVITTLIRSSMFVLLIIIFLFSGVFEFELNQFLYTYAGLTGVIFLWKLISTYER